MILFNSVSYLLFLLIAATLYWLLPQRRRIHLLLLASLAFYAAWRVEFVALIVLSVLVDFLLSIRIRDAESQRRRRFYLWLSLSTNLALLVYFKYTYFIVDNLALVMGGASEPLRAAAGSIVLPLGISFYTSSPSATRSTSTGERSSRCAISGSISPT